MSTPVPQKTLTNFANGLFNEATDEKSTFIAPVVPTGIVTFSVIDYAKRSGFQTPSGARAIGGDSKAVQSDGDRIDISLKPNGLHDFIDDHELDQAGSQGLALLRQSRTQNLVSQAGNTRFKDTLAQINSVTGAGIATDWSSSGDPILEIDTLIEEMNDSTGILPNRILLSLKAWRIFRNHPKVLARYPGKNKVSPSISEAEGFFLTDIKILVCTTVFDTKIAATSAITNAMGADLYLFFAESGANIYDNSFVKTFRIRTGMESNVRTSQKDYGEKLMVDWTEIVYVNNPSAGKRLAISE
jgi:hypothetical protein